MREHMTMEKVLAQAHALHIELWNWCLENPGKQKYQWPRWEANGGDIPPVCDNCFACEVAEKRRLEYEKETATWHGTHGICKFCPIDDCYDGWKNWGLLTQMLSDGNNLTNEAMETLAKCAKLIRDKEWKE